jgi:adenosylcobinamide kinase/adenosylcobinamide-phosphate guanylyltransferase
MTFTLVLGGARSGKTAFAQAQAEAAATRPTLIATGQAFDDEMRARIDRHRAERGDRWATIEAPLDLIAALAASTADDAVVVDCLTLWLSNLLHAGNDCEASTRDLIIALAACPARVWLVGNEVGQGIVPDNALARRFRDEAGWMHQRLAAAAREVFLIVAGLPLCLKPGRGVQDRHALMDQPEGTTP